MSDINLFQLGVTAAEAGDQEQARALLLQVVEENPNHEEAWIWLCDLVDDPEDRIIALENVLTINPENHDARVLLETLQSARTEAPENKAGTQSRVFSAVPTEPLKRSPNQKEEINSILARAGSPTTPLKDRRVMQARSRSRLMAVHRAINAGDRETALSILVQMIEEDENNEEAWFLLGHIAPTVEDQRIALENMLILNPDNKPAAQRLKNLKPLLDENPLETILWEEDETLLKIVESFLAASKTDNHPSNGIEKDQHHSLNGEDEPDQEEKKPTLRLLKIALWPTLFFVLLILIQTFLKPLGFTPALILGILSVYLGSVLAAASCTTPRHPLWLDYFGEPGEKLDQGACWIFGSLGWILAVGPFVVFFIFTIQILMPYFILTR